MARIGVEQAALTDARFAHLAHLAGYADADHAIGKMIRVWNECQERETDVLPLWVVAHHLGTAGASSLVPAGLAALVSAGDGAGEPRLRIKGCAGRTEWLGKNRASASKGGRARAADAARSGGRFTSRVAGEKSSQSHQPGGGKVTSAPDLAPDLAPDPAPDQHPEPREAEPAARLPSAARGQTDLPIASKPDPAPNAPSCDLSEGGRQDYPGTEKAPQIASQTPLARSQQRGGKSAKPKPEVEGLKETIAAFDSAYRKQSGGAPTWGAKQVAMLKPLIKAHGADEVQRRIGILFTRPPSWLRGPYDLGTLVAQFDKLAAGHRDAMREAMDAVTGQESKTEMAARLRPSNPALADFLEGK